MHLPLMRAGAALALGLLASMAHAGRPLATEDADVLARGECELEGYGSRELARGQPAVHGAALQFGCGIDRGLQFALATGRTRSQGDTSTGWAASGKSAIVPRGEESIGLTLAWLLDARRTPGRSLKHETSALALVATRAWRADWLAHANLGWSRSESAGASTATWNLAVERAVGHGVDLMAEVYGTDRERAWVGTGVRWSVGERLSLNASWAVQDGAPRTRNWSLGFKLGF
ncbi:MAG TPA: hypothetical protein VNO84_10060 [Burkholderiaceae bacterium]|nr:hypothetical protein [Burkholderiaceae bacterium]